MRIRFWGTRGSIPVALTAADVRDKLAQALVQASGRTFATYEEAHAFASSELDFSITHTFGGHSPCVEIEIPGSDEYFVCDMGSGARPFGVHVMAKQARAPATVKRVNAAASDSARTRRPPSALRDRSPGRRRRPTP